MSLIVQKFGGSSVRDAPHLMRAANIIQKTREAGNDVIVVLSAQGDTTDDLLRRAREVAAAPDARELDMLLATGEQASVALGAMALGTLGIDAVSLCAWQLPLLTDDVHGGARIASIGHERIARELACGRVVLVAGFQGIDGCCDVTTLGRGGSDTSAVALAAAFDAELCQIYTDVDGIYTTDPRICPAARRIPCVSYDHMQLFARHGAQVLHDRSVALAARFGVPLEVRSCEAGSVGSRVAAEGDSGGVTGVTRRFLEPSPLVKITAVGEALPSTDALTAAVSALEEAGVVVRAIEEGERYISLFAARAAAGAALCAMHGAFFPTE